MDKDVDILPPIIIKDTEDPNNTPNLLYDLYFAYQDIDRTSSFPSYQESVIMK